MNLMSSRAFLAIERAAVITVMQDSRQKYREIHRYNEYILICMYDINGLLTHILSILIVAPPPFYCIANEDVA